VSPETASEDWNKPAEGDPTPPLSSRRVAASLDSGRRAAIELVKPIVKRGTIVRRRGGFPPRVPLQSLEEIADTRLRVAALAELDGVFHAERKLPADQRKHSLNGPPRAASLMLAVYSGGL